MKHLLSTLLLGATALVMTSCVDPMVGPGGYGYARRPGYYDPGYAPRPGYGVYEREHEHHYERDDRSYYGGPAAWYQAGEGLGRRDRREHRSCDYRRHRSQYDGRTEREFARGYEAGYRRG